MVERSCSLCREKNYKVLYKKDNFNIVQCRNCDLIFVNPCLSQSVINKKYNQSYYIRPKKAGPKHLGYIDYNQRYLTGKEQWRNQLTLDKIESYKKQSKKLLDVGAATGFFVRDAKTRGWQAEGLEISAWAVNYARQKLKVKMTLSDLKSAKFKNNSFNAVIMNDFLEHVQDPLAELIEANRILKHDGVIYIETLNFDGLINTKLIGKEYVYIAPSLHLTYFAKKQLIAMLGKACFKVLKIELTSSSVGDFEYEGWRMYWRYFQFIILSVLGLKKVKNWAFKDIIKIIAQKTSS